MNLVIVSGEVRNNAYFGEDATDVWQGQPSELPLDVVQAWMDGLEEDGYDNIEDPAKIWHELKQGDDAEIATASRVSFTGTYHVLEFQWRDD